MRAVTIKPYIPASAKLAELTAGPLVLGTILGVVFGASSLYLVLKVGLTVSASIPVAVISITFFRILAKFGLKDATILENNIVQTAGSAGESIAFGIGVTMPAIMILGFDLEIARVALVAVLGGLLGILMMIPLRRALIVDQHETLKYPEGTACAEVLKAGASRESIEAHEAGDLPLVPAGVQEGREPLFPEARGAQATSAEEGARGASPLEHEGGATTIFAGFGIGLVYKAAMEAFKAWKDTPEKIFGAPFKGASVSGEISPELLGVGYIIGPRIASIMCAGGVLAYLVLIPMIKFFGSALPEPLAPGHELISKMGPDEIRGAYVLYIGAGAVAAGGIISLARSLPTIWHGLRGGLADFRRGQREKSTRDTTLRTERDLPMKVVLYGSLALVVAIVLATPLRMNILGAILIVLFGFLFVTVSSRLTGEIGSSSNPISGMTVATLLLTCLIFLILGWTGPTYYVTALSVGAIVCIAASNGGTTSQDLKTGWLIGSTPRAQQIAILIGALTSALILGPILLKLNDAATVYVETHVVAANDTTAETSANKPDFFAISDRMHVDPHKLEKREKLTGPQAATDGHDYLVWNNQDEALGPAGKYFVDDTGTPKYFVDPGINGTHAVRPDGTKVTKFDAPKATLMSYIIKGILNRQLPWGLVLLGVMISVVLEMSGIPSLAFAVGVYLPLSSSTPILAGGTVRWLVDRYTKSKLAKGATEEEIAAEGDKSPGVLMASGYIAGGAIAGIVIAFFAGVLSDFQAKVDAWADAHNPLFGGAHADILSLVPFALLTLLLWATGRELVFAKK